MHHDSKTKLLFPPHAPMELFEKLDQYNEQHMLNTNYVDRVRACDVMNYLQTLSELNLLDYSLYK